VIKTRAGDVIGRGAGRAPETRLHLRLYRFRELRLAGVPYTRKHVIDLEKKGTFPQRVYLSENTVAWVAEEVDSWVEERIRARAPRAA
jgi:prophage regulatory protein